MELKAWGWEVSELFHDDKEWVEKSELDKAEEKIKSLETKLSVAKESFKKIKALGSYCGGNPSKDVMDYLLKQAGINSRVIAEEALEKIEGVE